MSINQFIEQQLTMHARRVLAEASERALEVWNAAAAYRRAFRMTREFRRFGG